MAAILGFLGVALGAFGAHGLEGTLEANERVETWETAVLYNLVHAVALLAAASRASKVVVGRAFKGREIIKKGFGGLPGGGELGMHGAGVTRRAGAQGEQPG